MMIAMAIRRGAGADGSFVDYFIVTGVVLVTIAMIVVCLRWVFWKW